MNKREYLFMKNNRKSFVLKIVFGIVLFLLGNMIVLYAAYHLNQYVIRELNDLIALRYLSVFIPLLVYYIVFGLLYGSRVKHNIKQDTEYYLISQSFTAKTDEKSIMEYTLKLNNRILDNNYEEIHERVFHHGRQYKKKGKNPTCLIVLEYPNFDISAFEALVLDVSEKYISYNKCYFLIVADETSEEIRDFLNYEINTKDLQFHYTLLDINLGEFAYKYPHLNNNRNQLAKNFKYMYKIMFNSSKKELRRKHKEETR
jgi:hypothetical protein